MSVRNIALLGATGSIGASTIDVVARHPDRFRISAVAAHRNVERLAEVCRRCRPEVAAMLDPASARELEKLLAADRIPTRVLAGADALIDVATWNGTDTVLAAIVGAAGLAPTLAAARAGKRILLANKEALVIGGELFMRAVRDGGAMLVPIDSEHNAVFQCLPHGYARDPEAAGVERILLTASGGPFRTRDLSDLEHVTPDQACAHPRWSMGRKISVDSATMMNKGLEVIEAHWLFGVARERIEVVVHPESVVHSLVEYRDGSVLAQLGNPDMRTPIAQALASPQRIESGARRLDLAQVGSLNFERPDFVRFPCLQLAYDALDAGGCASIALNAANEVAVAAFLSGRIRYPRIPAACATTLERVSSRMVASVEDCLAVDAEARRIACEALRLPPSAGASLAA
ncbi:MAG TPA: 1-deoxy-D-xylulose-5-phosphate reductoisomerase [Casimicrobiaceae bacterium]|nr:1-deoxy-D-xylulose-5-phosphate reductoisomerase [Casimicrobiaceae bacterium]